MQAKRPLEEWLANNSQQYGNEQPGELSERQCAAGVMNSLIKYQCIKWAMSY